LYDRATVVCETGFRVGPNLPSHSTIERFARDSSMSLRRANYEKTISVDETGSGQ
jgi:hypothetical protein